MASSHMNTPKATAEKHAWMTLARLPVTEPVITVVEK